MKTIHYKTITADTQVTTEDCYLIGAEFSYGLAIGSVATNMIIYDEPDNTKSASKKVLTLKTYSGFKHYDSKMFPKPGIKCNGIYVDWNAGIGTVYYHF